MTEPQMPMPEDQSPVANETNNIVIFCSPQKQTEETGPWFIAAIAADPDNKIEADLKTALPPFWNGKYQAHFAPVADLEIIFESDLLAQLGVSHLAYLESIDQGESDPIYFAGQTITRNGAVMWFSEAKQQYYMIHCRRCAIALLGWMLEGQDKWEKLASLPAGRA